MRKTFLLTLACLVVVLFAAPPASAFLGFTYGVADYGAPCSWAGTEGGETTDIVYWQNGAGRWLETDFDYGVQHPDANNVIGDGYDQGLMERSFCTSGAFNSDNLSDNANLMDVGDQAVHASVWTDDGAGNAYMHPAFTLSTDWHGYMVVFSALTDGAGSCLIGNGPASLASCEVGSYDTGADNSVLITGAPATNLDSGVTDWAHLEFTASPSGIQTGNPANNLANVIRGYDIYRADTDPALSVPGDFAKANTFTVRDDGTTVMAGNSVDSGITGGGNLFYNDESLPSAVATTHFSVSPILVAGTAQWPDGVRVFFEGNSWYPVGGKGAPISGMGTDAKLVSFSAKLNERGDKVTLNWRTASEDGIVGFNIVRKFKLNGHDRGKAVKVNRNLIVAKGTDGGGADYSFVDTLRMPPQLQRARGLEVQYELETVGADGNTSVLGHSSVSPKVTR